VYNAEGTNEIPFVVDSKLGGTNTLALKNTTSYNMEIRRNSPRGPVLGYAPSQVNTEIYLIDGNYSLFPVFKKYDATRDLITTIYPKRPDSTPMRTSKALEGDMEIEVNASDYSSGLNGFTSGYAYLVVTNNSSSGVQVMKGDAVQQTGTGVKMVNAGAQRTFLVEMPVLTSGDGTVYAAKTVFAGWTIGETGVPKAIPVSVALQDGAVTGGDNQNVFEVDYLYTVTVTTNAGVLVIAAPTKGSKVTP
jgi:hypothetical protein